jgi:phage-related tail protein
MNRLEDILTQNEMIKIESYLNSNDYGKINIAKTKLDKFIKDYLIYSKNKYQIRKLDEALKFLQIKYDDLINNGINNIILKNIIDRFIEYKEIREKIKSMDDNNIEKDRLIKVLNIRGLWEIK